MESKNLIIEKLTNNNYFTWKYQMELVLVKEELWDVLIGEAPTTVRALSLWNKKDAKARATIGLSVQKDQLVHIRDKSTALQTWIALKNALEKDTLTNRVSLYKRIAMHRMKDTSKMEDHINELVSLFQKLSDLGEQATDQWKIGMLFASLPKKYSTLITALEARNESDLTWSLAFTKILDEHQRQTEGDEETFEQEKVLKIEKELFCHFCKRNNHKMKECYKFKRYQEFQEWQNQKGEKKEDEKINEIESDNEEYVLSMTEKANKSPIEWIVDSGATRHICNNQESFRTLKQLNETISLTLPDGTKILAENEGTCEMKTINEKGEVKRIGITNVLFAPEVKHNFLSVSKIDQKGYTVLFKNNKCVILDNNTIITTAILKDNLYIVEDINENISEETKRSSNFIGNYHGEKTIEKGKQNGKKKFKRKHQNKKKY